MAKKKKVTKVVEEAPEVTVVSTDIKLLSVDYGREDLNDMARKINEIIIKING
jgi:hypothetical protein